MCTRMSRHVQGPICDHFARGFERARASRGKGRRVGAELKFPFVMPDGSAAEMREVDALWSFLASKGWEQVTDEHVGLVIGARKPGPRNDTVAGCETGFCKVEFSLAHAGDLHELAGMLEELRGILAEFSESTGVGFLGLGIHPVTPPSGRLEMKKGRNVFWKKAFGSNDHISPEEGDDVHLFTVSASNQIHVDVSKEEAAKALNVFNGFAPAQIACTANSNVWKGELDPEHKCVGELFWDWWLSNGDRHGIPPRPFESLEDYVETLARMRPVYVKRDGHPVGLPGFASFADYYASKHPEGVDVEGNGVALEPQPDDIDRHATFCWYCARISRYYTLENRVNDQQPPEDLICVAALTLGLTEAMDEGWAVLRRLYEWEDLRQARLVACKDGLEGEIGTVRLRGLAWIMLGLADMGLRQRGLGEEKYLAPLRRRVMEGVCPAAENEALFKEGGLPALLTARWL